MVKTPNQQAQTDNENLSSQSIVPEAKNKTATPIWISSDVRLRREAKGTDPSVSVRKIRMAVLTALGDG